MVFLNLYFKFLVFLPSTSKTRARQLGVLSGGPESWPSCLWRRGSGGVPSPSLDATPGAFAIQRLSFNFLCTQQKKILYQKWWYFGTVCILQNGKRLQKFLPFYLGGFRLKWIWNSTLGYISKWFLVSCVSLSNAHRGVG